MSTEARLARLERRQRAGSEVSDQEHLRLGAAIVLAKYRGDDTGVAELRAQLARLPPPAQGGALDAALRCAAASLGLELPRLGGEFRTGWLARRLGGVYLLPGAAMLRW